MEWVLQVLDECDDLLATAAQWFLGVSAAFSPRRRFAQTLSRL